MDENEILPLFKRLLLNQLHKSSQIQINETKMHLLESHCRLMTKWNRVHNLTSIENVEQLVSEHYSDCLMALWLCKSDLKKADPVYDLGAGNGFPGVIGAILYPETNFILVESSRKKCSFLRVVAAELPLPNLSILQRRVEDLSQVKIALTRAAFSEPKINELSDVFGENGCLILMTVPSFPSDNWLQDSKNWIAKEKRPYVLSSGAQRSVVTLEKRSVPRETTEKNRSMLAQFSSLRHPENHPVKGDLAWGA